MPPRFDPSVVSLVVTPFGRVVLLLLGLDSPVDGPAGASRSRHGVPHGVIPSLAARAVM